MALQKSIEVGDTGLFCDYIKVVGILYEADNGLVQVQIGVYASKEASKSGKQPVNKLNLDLKLDNLSGNGDIRAQVYVALKDTENFSGAIDV